MKFEGRNLVMMAIILSAFYTPASAATNENVFSLFTLILGSNSTSARYVKA
jgi:hypothetical protein